MFACPYFRFTASEFTSLLSFNFLSWDVIVQAEPRFAMEATPSKTKEFSNLPTV